MKFLTLKTNKAMYKITKLEKQIKALEGKINPYKVTANNFLLENLYKELRTLKNKNNV